MPAGPHLRDTYNQLIVPMLIAIAPLAGKIFLASLDHQY
jgi:hypothetical protein